MNNSRIKELVEQAGFYMTEKNGAALAQFAELIVRECADVATINQFQYDDVGNYVKKHFGIDK